ncbi:MAG: hypothetical protein H7A35_11535 [Planctomycetales bacterium]|nr:hypothetical protein [bacterium]UNM07492.1 MAG: hypothetical protein H7A35_11535 [Planctomycetales bacterium]
MPMRPESSHNPARYHWAALAHPAHVTGAVIGWLSTAGLGVASMGSTLSPELAGWTALASIAWSGVWLLVMPGNPRFRRVTDARLAEIHENDFDYQQDALRGRISGELKGSMADIARLRDKAREILQDKFGSHDPFARDNLQKLDTLAISYLQLLVVLTEYDNYLNLVDPGSLERELAEARQRLDEATDSAVRDARASQLKLLENRLEKYHGTESRLELVRQQCRNVETTMKLLVDQAMTAVDAKRVSRDIEQVLENIRQSETLGEELAVYDDLERELDKLDRRELE